MARRQTPPRISVDTTEEIDSKLRELIPHGLKKPLFNRFAKDIIAMIEVDEDRATELIGAIIKNGITIKE